MVSLPQPAVINRNTSREKGYLLLEVIISIVIIIFVITGLVSATNFTLQNVSANTTASIFDSCIKYWYERQKPIVKERLKSGTPAVFNNVFYDYNLQGSPLRFVVKTNVECLGAPYDCDTVKQLKVTCIRQGDGKSKSIIGVVGKL